MKKGSHSAGFTLVEIMIVIGIVALLAAIAIPNLFKARATARTKRCINNLRLIDGAIQQWATDKNKPSSATVTEADVAPYLGRANAVQAATFLEADVICPAGGNYVASLKTVTDKPACDKYDVLTHNAEIK